MLCGKADAAMFVFPHFLFEKVKVSFKGRRFSMIQRKLQNPLARFQKMNLWKCFEQLCDYWTWCINCKETTGRAALIVRVRAVCVGEINPVQRQITPHTVALYQCYILLMVALSVTKVAECKSIHL